MAAELADELLLMAPSTNSAANSPAGRRMGQGAGGRAGEEGEESGEESGEWGGEGDEGDEVGGRSAHRGHSAAVSVEDRGHGTHTIKFTWPTAGTCLLQIKVEGHAMEPVGISFVDPLSPEEGERLYKLARSKASSKGASFVKRRIKSKRGAETAVDTESDDSNSSP